jgi:hypothetical protein
MRQPGNSFLRKLQADALTARPAQKCCFGKNELQAPRIVRRRWQPYHFLRWTLSHSAKNASKDRLHVRFI